MVHCIAPSDRHHGHVCPALGKHMGRWCYHHHDKAKEDYISYKKDELKLQDKNIEGDVQTIQLLETIVTKRKAFQEEHVHSLHRDDAHSARIQTLLEQRDQELTRRMSDILGMNTDESDDTDEPEPIEATRFEDSEIAKQERLSRSQRRRLTKQNREDDLKLLNTERQSQKLAPAMNEHPPSKFEVEGLALLDENPAVELYTLAFIQVLHLVWNDHNKAIHRNMKHSVVLLALIKCTAFALAVSKQIMIQKLDITEDSYSQFAAHIGFIQFLVCESRAWGFPIPLNMSFISLLGKIIGDERRDSLFERKICMILLKTQCPH